MRCKGNKMGGICMINQKSVGVDEEEKYYIVIKENKINEEEAVEAVEQFLKEKYCVELNQEGKEKLLRPFMLMKYGSPYQINLKMVSLNYEEFRQAAVWFYYKGISIERGMIR